LKVKKRDGEGKIKYRFWECGGKWGEKRQESAIKKRVKRRDVKR